MENSCDNHELSWDVREGIYSVACKYRCCNWEGQQHRQFYRQHHHLNLQLDRHHIIRPARVFLPRVGRILVAHTPHSSYPILYPPIHDDEGGGGDDGCGSGDDGDGGDEGDIFFSFAPFCLFWVVAHIPHSSYPILYPPIHIISHHNIWPCCPILWSLPCFAISCLWFVWMSEELAILF